jgi:hypothetical protein
MPTAPTTDRPNAIFGRAGAEPHAPGPAVRENHVVEFDEGHRIAWLPAEPGQAAPGHLWRWELEPIDSARTHVTHTYDWTRLTDQRCIPRARATTADRLQAPLDRLAALAERQ